MLQTLIIAFDLKNKTFYNVPLEEVDFTHSHTQMIYWIHCNLNQPEEFQHITQKINLPVELFSIYEEEDTIPKLVEENDSLLIKIECLTHNTLVNQPECQFSNIVIYLTEQYCFTACKLPIPAIDEFNNNVHKYLKYAKTPCFILYLILDNTINDYSKLLLEYEILADQIDIDIREKQEIIYNNVMAIKKQVMKVQHHIAAIRDMLMRISGRKISVISEPCRLSLVNLLEHTQIIFNEAEVIREVLKNTLAQIDNALMQRLNNTMKVLTAFAAIFLPLSLIAAIYGMNFRWMPELEWRYGYYWALALMVICGIALAIIFKKKKWW